MKTQLLLTCCLVLTDWTSSISAQIQGSDSIALQSHYRDLEAPDPAVRGRAFEKLRSDRELLNSPETAEGGVPNVVEGWWQTAAGFD